MAEQLFPFRIKIGKGRIEAEFPGECEPQCVISDELRDQLGYAGYAEWIEYLARTRDDRQCRGCGRWGLFELRAITANLPNGSLIYEAGEVFTRPVGSDGPWEPIGTTAGMVIRPDREPGSEPVTFTFPSGRSMTVPAMPVSQCPCCVMRLGDDCWCDEDCGSPRCQMAEADDDG